MTQFDTANLQHLINTSYTDVNHSVCTIDSIQYYIVKMTAYPQSNASAFYFSTDKKAKKTFSGQFFVDFDDSGIITEVKQGFVY